MWHSSLTPIVNRANLDRSIVSRSSNSTHAKLATNYLTLDLSEVRKNLAPDVSDLYVDPEVEHQFHVLAHSSEVPG